MLPEKFYATLEAVLYVALRSGGSPVSGKEICAYQKVSSRHLEPILQTLVRKGILRGAKGPRGGYTLAKERRRITLAELFETSERQAPSPNPTALRGRVVEPCLEIMHKKMLALLATVTIEDLCEGAVDLMAMEDKPDFTI